VVSAIGSGSNAGLSAWGVGRVVAGKMTHDTELKLWLGTALIAGGALCLWGGWLIGAWIGSLR